MIVPVANLLIYALHADMPTCPGMGPPSSGWSKA
jgi:hypothetical protein